MRADADLIIDAVVGTGFKPPLKGLALEALEWLKSLRNETTDSCRRFPSGWPADSTEGSGE